MYKCVSSGLAPQRNIWALIDRFKQDRCVVLTTHSMDEAEALCGRIGIMSHGKLRCLGENLHLKNLYGNGFKMELRVRPGTNAAVDSFMQTACNGQNKRLESTSPDVLIYQLSKTTIKLSAVLREVSPRGGGVR